MAAKLHPSHRLSFHSSQASAGCSLSAMPPLWPRLRQHCIVSSNARRTVVFKPTGNGPQPKENAFSKSFSNLVFHPPFIVVMTYHFIRVGIENLPSELPWIEWATADRLFFKSVSLFIASMIWGVPMYLTSVRYDEFPAGWLRWNREPLRLNSHVLTVEQVRIHGMWMECKSINKYLHSPSHCHYTPLDLWG